MDKKSVYRQCLSEIKAIENLYDQSGPIARCLNVPLARQKMAELKANWKTRIKQGKDTEVELVVTEALTRIDVKSNSNPNNGWLDDLYSAAIDLNFYLDH